MVRQTASIMGVNILEDTIKILGGAENPWTE